MTRPKKYPEVAIESEYIGLIMTCDVAAMQAAMKTDPGALNARTEWGATVLHRAAQFGCLGLVSLFLDSGIPVDVRDFTRNIPLHSSCESYNDAAEVAEELLDRGANIDARNSSWQSPLMLAARRANLRHVELLLGRGANVAFRDRMKWSALDHAIYQIEGNDLDDAQKGLLERMITLLREAN